MIQLIEMALLDGGKGKSNSKLKKKKKKLEKLKKKYGKSNDLEN
jgi:hypothetical protein